MTKTIIDLIRSKKLDQYNYATLSCSNFTKLQPDSEILIEDIGKTIRICRKYKCQLGIGTNVNGINAIRLTFDWRVLWYNANGIKHYNWGDDLDCLLDLCKEMKCVNFVIQNEIMGYKLGENGEIKDEYEIFDDV